MNYSRGGKIYWVKMNSHDMVPDVSGTSHEYRPFLALEEMNDRKIRGYYTTSNLRGLYFRNHCFTKYRTILSDRKYQLKKPSVVSLQYFVDLDNENILGFIDSIDQVDLLKVLKMSQLCRNNSLELKGKHISEGDLVSKEDRAYLIYNRDHSYSYGFQVKNRGKIHQSKVEVVHDCHYFASAEDIYRVYFDKYITISNSDDVILQDHVADDTLAGVHVKRKMQKQSVKKSKK